MSVRWHRLTLMPEPPVVRLRVRAAATASRAACRHCLSQTGNTSVAADGCFWPKAVASSRHPGRARDLGFAWRWQSPKGSQFHHA